MLKIYVCGPTVYNDVHIGNMRPILTIDLMLKGARYLNKPFTFIHNITDIDDKIIKQASLSNITEKELSSKYANAYLDLLNTFGVDTISQVEYVTENLDLINDFISKMVTKDDAYTDKENNVWFDVAKNKDNYGSVSNQKYEALLKNNSDFEKQNSNDFALWKKTQVGVTFDSHFGKGRPGWHTECAALIYKHFNNQGVDIHGGGMDLTFPHHENENIQYLSVTGNKIAKNWLRTGQINLNNEKMSKSLQNVILTKDFLLKHSPDVLKMIFLSNSITGIINIDDNLINNSLKTINKLKKIFFRALVENNDASFDKAKTQLIFEKLFASKFSDFLFEVNSLIKEANTGNLISQKTLIEIFTVLKFDLASFDYAKYINIYHQWKEELANKNYEQSDKLRNILMENQLI
ncbi:class I tRNA ligase family protein [Mycoplasmopsis gallinacea]|uniref:Cysteine--tRNA ligase n=1 Tax=Mycoplasmopsis gallinacea TaxID=29556 RepID=A0A449A3S4_9BACT|nr:class I tRNA ligase family protein [Mycoplasmopsis gallinacea]VEU58899.1 Cysteine--tRNA ligase [Mycoplasmopsis gallinacea]